MESLEQTEQKNYFRSRGVFISCLIIIVSLISGAVGGAFGTLYLLRQPESQKWFTNLNLEQNQKVILQEESAVIDVVKKAGPAVVSIVISKDLDRYQGYGMDPFSPFFPFFGLGFGAESQNNTPNIQQVGAGTGFFVTTDGLIVTNKHVIADEQASYSVLTSDGKTYDAKVVARDPVNDLAIVKIEIQNAPILKLADSGQLQVGQKVIAIGNSLGQYQNTVTTGIVSGIGRSIVAGGSDGSEQLEGVVQTDAAINPGNSGGPLLNSLGEVIGINTAIDQEGQSVGFAIASNDAQRAVESYKKSGKIIRPYLGVRYVLITKAMAEQQKLTRSQGALIVRGDGPNQPGIISGSPAEKAGLKEDDIILEVDGNIVNEGHSLVALLKSKHAGDTVSLKVFSGGSEKTVKVTLEESK